MGLSSESVLNFKLKKLASEAMVCAVLICIWWAPTSVENVNGVLYAIWEKPATA